MKIFDKENIDELLEIRQIRQYFPQTKFCAIQYTYIIRILTSSELAEWMDYIASYVAVL